ncbi:MAG: hypothetical protein IT290_01890 [Deltaproteobacteria bacterium]|nr:hypothetical protein [Deltaproteobacteria bacterium]
MSIAPKVQEMTAGLPGAVAFTARGLPSNARLRITGAIPQGFDFTLNGARGVTIEGVTGLPQSCTLYFDGVQGDKFAKQVKRKLNVNPPAGTSAYSATVQVIGETATYYLLEITAVNNGGLPLTSAVVHTFVSGAAGGIYANDIVTLPEVPIGSQAVATLWYKKGKGLVEPSLLLRGTAPAGAAVAKRSTGITANFTSVCTFEQLTIDRITLTPLS